MTYVVWKGLRMGAGPVTVGRIPRMGEHFVYLGYEYEVDQVIHDHDKGCVRINVMALTTPGR